MRALILVTLVLAFLPQTKTEPTIALVFHDRVEIVAESQARTEYETLLKANKVRDPRFVALTLALSTTPEKPRCITWEQHVAEVTSWWAAPERKYVPCSDPRVGPALQGGN